ncbi:MAG TPA: enoyl-CoA hydratase/isomerase family protein [Thermoleophilaceae bacterium]
MTPVIAVEEHGDVALVRVDRPPANAMDLDLLERLLETLERLKADDPGAVVVIGSGSFFSAGLDVKVLPTLDDDDKRAMVDGINRMFLGWYELPRPLVCAVNGHAVAGGMILVLCGDRRIGSTEGTFGLTEVRVGVPYPACALELVRAELSSAAARRLALTAGHVDAETALALDVVDELARPGEVEPRALELAAELAHMPRSAFAITKSEMRAESLARMRRALEETDPVIRYWLEEISPLTASRAGLAPEEQDAPGEEDD